MKTPINVFLIILIMISCNEKHNQIDSYSLTEDSLIYQLVDSLLMPDSIWRKHLLIPPTFQPEHFSKSELKKRRDSLLQKWDTAQLYIAFDDTLIDFSKSYHSKRLKNTKEYFKYNIENIDTSYFQLLDKLVNDTLLSKRKIDIKGFRTNYNYKIIPLDSIKSVQKKGFRIIETHQFSRIVFNEKFDKACFYEQGVCGGECGGGYLIFLEKKNGIWRIIEKKLLWVS